MNQPRKKLLDRFADLLISHHYSASTVKLYRMRVRQYIIYHGLRHPETMGDSEVEAFMNHLNHDKGLSVSSQKQAISALNILYEHLLQKPLSRNCSIQWSRRPRKLPVVLSDSEARNLIDQFHGFYRILASLYYGCGFRLNECLNLAVSDIDFSRRVIRINQGKFRKDREVALPGALEEPLHFLVDRAIRLHSEDAAVFSPNNPSPGFLGRYRLIVPKESRDQKLFARDAYKINHKEQTVTRPVITDRAFQYAIKSAADRAGLMKKVTPHTLRHSFATEMLRLGINLRYIQDRLGHSNIKTTMLYLHLDDVRKEVASPLD